MAVTQDMLVTELQNLLRLTAFEQTVATVRRAQAASTPIAEELKANAAKSVERSQLLKDAVRQVGGVPDVVGAALGKAGAFVQTQLNQVQTLQGALLGDLALEHQLRERTRYARTLAESLGYHNVLPVLDRLETAHSATIEWLETRLAEVGRTGTSALEATPVQAAVGAVRKVAGAPFGLLASGVNRGSSLLRRGASNAVTAAGSAVETATSTVGRAADTATSAAGKAVDTAVATAEAAAEDVTGYTDGGADDASDAGAQQVLDVASLDEDHPPFAGYASLSGDSRHAPRPRQRGRRAPARDPRVRAGAQGPQGRAEGARGPADRAGRRERLVLPTQSDPAGTSPRGPALSRAWRRTAPGASSRPCAPGACTPR